MSDPTFITRVELRNYKSIAGCDVRLGPLTFLVGPNGAGKSNFLDALRFVSDALRSTVDHALRERGGIGEVRRRSGGHPNNFAVKVRFRLPDGSLGSYGLRIGAKRYGGFEIQEEQCEVLRPPAEPAHFSVAKGELRQTTLAVPPPVAKDRLYLVYAGGIEQFRGAYEALSRMGFYNLVPARIRQLQDPDPGDLLERDGRNIVGVLKRLAETSPATKARIEEYLAAVVPGVRRVDAATIGPKETLEFRQTVLESSAPWRFSPANMSDGTLRALGVLVALFQPGDPDGGRIPLIGIEEPEVALHPAAAGVLLDILQEASQERQTVVTSHSPDLLDRPSVSSGSLLAVLSCLGATAIGDVDEAGRTALREGLYTAGELLRMDQLRPDRSVIERPYRQLVLAGDA